MQIQVSNSLIAGSPNIRVSVGDKEGLSFSFWLTVDDARKLARDIDQDLEGIDRADEIEAMDVSTHGVDFGTCDACGDDATREQHEAARLGGSVGMTAPTAEHVDAPGSYDNTNRDGTACGWCVGLLPTDLLDNNGLCPDCREDLAAGALAQERRELFGIAPAPRTP